MGSPVRPEADPVAAYLSKYGKHAPTQAAAPDDPVASYLAKYGKSPTPETPGVLARAGEQIGGFFEGLVEHPGETIGGIVKAPLESVANMLAPSKEQAAQLNADRKSHPERLPGYDFLMNKGGFLPDDYKGVTGKERAAAALQTAANVAFPSVAGKVAGGLAKAGASRFLANLAGAATAGSAAGAAYSPDDPAAGAIAGATLTPLIAAAGKGAGKAGASAGSRILDVVGRPATTRPLIKAGPLEAGEIEGAPDRAARVLASKFDRAGLDAGVMEQTASASGRPLAPIDLAGTTGQRAARGLKTSSAPAEAALRAELHPRAEGAVERVIEHGLETTGLKNRVSGLETVDQLIAERSKHGNENYRPIWEKQTAPLDNPDFAKIANTPAGREALKRGQIIAANGFENIGTIADLSAPPEGVSPADWANVQRIAQERGIPIDNPNAPRRIAPTLQQAHFIKLGFDDMLRSPPEPGSGGSGPINAGKIRDLRTMWLKAMDNASKEYGDARKVYADESALIDAAEVGRNLWKMHPDEAAKAFREMSQAERDVARRTGFDALAERIENGPQDVSKGASKPRDVKRIRLLFPDEASFEQWRQGLREEAQMLSSQRGALDGSNTADKFADMAEMAGVTLPDVISAVRGNPIPLAARAGKALLGEKFKARADVVNVEQAKQLTAGASGKAGERTTALKRIEKYQAKNTHRDVMPPGMFLRLVPAATGGQGQSKR